MKNTKTILLLAGWMIPAVISLLSYLPSYGQMAIRYEMVEQQPPDSIDVVRNSKRHFWRAAGETIGTNVGLWAIDRFIINGVYSHISFKTIKENFKVGFKWDNDFLGTNIFAHPYNGSFYFLAGRSNGFNFWQSQLFAIAGSAMWEMIWENDYPSTNDIIATPIGGSVFGETLYRASDAILDDRATGWNRVGREIAGFLVAPMRGINRLFTGQAWRTSATSGKAFGIPSIAMRVSAGLNMLCSEGRMKTPYVGAAVQFDMEYGDRFEAVSHKPYDYFTLRIDLQGLKYQPVLNRISIKGRLLSKELFDSRRSSGTIGLYQDFDYYDGDSIKPMKKVPYKLGIPASFGAGFMFRDVQRRHHVFDAYVHANAVLLGCILSDHYRENRRTYNYAQGFSIKAGANIVFDRNKASLSVSNDFYRLFTWKGYKHGQNLEGVNYKLLNVMGDKSVASFNVFEFRFDYQIHKKWYATLSFINNYRSTCYRDWPHARSTTSTLRLMTTYKF